jgi:hypothetical protein
MSTPMQQLTEIAAGCVREAVHDYVGLWQIVGRVRRELGDMSDSEARRLSLDVVQRIVDQGLIPGDYLSGGFRAWGEHDTDAVVERIRREWDPDRGDPTLADPICWFRFRK